MPQFPVREFVPMKSFSVGVQHFLQKGKLYRVPKLRTAPKGYLVNSLEPLLACSSHYVPAMTHVLVMGESPQYGGDLVSLVDDELLLFLLTLDDGLGYRGQPSPAFDVFLYREQRVALSSGVVLPMHKVLV